MVSVIVPVYNVERYLCRCVESIQKQTYSELEIILVDDGSLDKSPIICDKFSNQDVRVKVIHKENQGVGFARNTGLEYATGKYVTFVDSDDWIAKDHIEKLVCAAQENDADAVIGSYTKAYANGRKVPICVGIEQRCYKRSQIVEKVVLPLIGAEEGYLYDVQLESSVCMNLYDLQIIRDNKVLFVDNKEIGSEDFFFNVDFLTRAKCVVAINEKGYFYYENSNSTTRKYDFARIKRIENYYILACAYADKYGIIERARERIERTYLMKIRVTLRLIVNSNMTYKQKCDEIDNIIKNKITQGILQSYPLKTCRWKNRLLLYMIKRKEKNSIFLYVAIANVIKGIKFWG